MVSADIVWFALEARVEAGPSLRSHAPCEHSFHWAPTEPIVGVFHHCIALGKLDRSVATGGRGSQLLELCSSSPHGFGSSRTTGLQTCGWGRGPRRGRPRAAAAAPPRCPAGTAGRRAASARRRCTAPGAAPVHGDGTTSGEGPSTGSMYVTHGTALEQALVQGWTEIEGKDGGSP